MIRKVWWKAYIVIVIVISSQIHFTLNSNARKPDFFFDLDFEGGYTENAGKIANITIENLKQIGINATYSGRYYVWFFPPKIPSSSSSLIDDTSGRNLLNLFYYFDENGYWRYHDFSYNSFPYEIPYMVESMEKLNEIKNLTNIDAQRYMC